MPFPKTTLDNTYSSKLLLYVYRQFGLENLQTKKTKFVPCCKIVDTFCCLHLTYEKSSSGWLILHGFYEPISNLITQVHTYMWSNIVRNHMKCSFILLENSFRYSSPLFLEYFEISWNFWETLEYFGMFWNVLEYFGIFWNILEFFWNILEFFGIF